MAYEFKITPNKTYATADEARKAVADAKLPDGRYFIMRSDNDQYFPVFVGASAFIVGLHFNIIA